ncbi:MAG: CBS domain-containing protein [Thermodesulfovibrionales bacterium]|nr:CBS domain-containing protein [Thermodesulfovibrionales bacterium]
MIEKQDVKSIMTDLFEFPHIPYWFSVKQAMNLIKKTYQDPKTYHISIGVLVFDEKYMLLGTVCLIDILKALFCKKKDDKGNVEYSCSISDEDKKAILELPVSRIMVPVKTFINEEDDVTKAIELMLKNDLLFLPVLDSKKKLTGILLLKSILSILPTLTKGQIK